MESLHHPIPAPGTIIIADIFDDDLRERMQEYSDRKKAEEAEEIVEEDESEHEG